MTFQAAPENAEFEAEEGGALAQPGDENEDGGLAARHVDLRLQTNEPSTKLQSRLRKTEHDARTFIESQGVNTLYLALGMLRWFESTSSQEARKAPLILVPVTLERSNVRERCGYFRIGNVRIRDAPRSPPGNGSIDLYPGSKAISQTTYENSCTFANSETIIGRTVLNLATSCPAYGRIVCHSCAVTNRERCPTLVVATTTSSPPVASSAA